MSSQYVKGFLPVEFDPFAQAEFEASIPAIEPQTEIITSCLIGGEDANRSYNESNSLRLKGVLNQPALLKALQELVNRHEALRANFSADGRYLFVCKELKLQVEFEDISSKTDEEKQRHIERFLLHNAHAPFDLLNGPLFRAALCKLAPDDHHLTLTAHHIVCDGWSFGILLEELGQLYSAFAADKEPVLPAAPSFTAYALEQDRFYQSESYHRIQQYWINQYQHEVPELWLPVDAPRSSFRTYLGQRKDFPLNKRLADALKSLGAKAGCSFVTTLLATFEIFLHKLSGQDKIVVGLPAAGQPATGYHRLVGHCVNLLPLRSAIENETTFLSFLKKQKSVVLDAYDHQLFTFGSLLKKLPIPRNPSRIPLVPVVFNIDMGMDNKVSFQGLSYQRISNPRAFESFELALNINGTNQSLVLEWSFNTTLFKPETIDGLMKDYEQLLTQLINDPNLRIESIKPVRSIQSLGEVADLNNTHSDFPKEKPLHVLIAEQAVTFAHKTAVTHKRKSITYKELDEKSNQLATLLLQSGVEKGDNVGLALDRSVEMVISLLAILKAGGAYVPIDPNYPKERVRFLLTDTGARHLLTTKKYMHLSNGVTNEIYVDDVLEYRNELSTAMPNVQMSGTDLAYVLYTSGSTGKPKGVEVEHRSLVNALFSAQKKPGIKVEDKLLAVIPVYFDPAALELYLPLLNGAEVVIADTEVTRDGRTLINLIRKENITMMMATPSTWRLMRDAGWNQPLPITAICGGESLTKDLAVHLLLHCREVWNMYGPTEATIFSTIKKIESSDQLTIGKPICNTQVYLLNQFHQSVGINETGEIYIAGEGVARGYLNRAELTKEKFIENPFSKQFGKLYRTGDLARLLPNGELQFIGRIDQQVKIRGNRVELGEIENYLNKSEGVSQSVVTIEDGHHGEPLLVAFIVPVRDGSIERTNLTENSTAASIAKWRQALKDQLPAYMLPGDYIIVQDLPLTSNGKIDREALSAIERTRILNSEEVTAPQTREEQIVADIWKKLLGLPQISIHDNFFDIGGHSLLTVQMMRQLEKETGINLPLSTLYEHSTVKKLAAKLSLADNQDHAHLVPIKRTGSKTPLYFIHGAHGDVFALYTLAKHMHPDQPIYGIRSTELSGHGPMRDRIEEIAAQYISFVLAQNPRGPYVLAGYCFGGFVAFEMAKQLKEMGKEVKMLIVIDAIANVTSTFDRPAVKWGHYLKEFAKRKLYDVRYTIKDPVWKFNYEKNRVLTPLVRYKRKLVGKKADPLLHKLELESKSIAAIRRYKLSAFDGMIHLFRAEKRVCYTPDMKYLGWLPYATKGVQTYEVPGMHDQIFFEPNVIKTAQLLQNCLDNVDVVRDVDSITAGQSESTRETKHSFRLKSVLSQQL